MSQGLDLPKDFLPLLTWPKFLYRQQREFLKSNAWQTWFIGGNGTGKTLIVYLADCLYLLGMHPYQSRIGTAPIKIKCLVPSFDNVEDVALEKLLEPQRILYPLPAEPHQEKWIKFLKKTVILI